MTLRKRAAILGFVALAFLAVYGSARHYSPLLVSYVVEQTLIEKAPDGVTPEAVDKRFGVLMESLPDGKKKMEKLLFLSQYLEKIQRLTPEELEHLLPVQTMAAGRKY